MSTVQRFFATATVASMLMSAALPVGAATAAELQAQIDALMATLNALQGQVQTAQGSTPTGTAPAACSGISFSRSLTVGSSGTDVKCLQALLNSSSDTQVSASGAGSPGSETVYFGSKTRAAVIKYQEKNASSILTPIGLSKGTGFVGAATRAKLTAWLAAPVAATPAPAPGAAPAPAPTPGQLSVLASGPAAQVIVSTQATANLADFLFTGSGTVSALTLKRIGVSADTSLSNVYLFDGALRITDAASVSSGNITFNTPSGLFTVAGTKTISVKSDMAAAAGETIGVQLTSVTLSSGTITGVPASGNLHSIAVATLATVNLTSILPGVTTTDPGTDVLAWQAQFNIGTRDVVLSRMALRQINSILTADIGNFRLLVDGVQVGSAVAALGANSYVTFSGFEKTLATGVRTVKVMADVTGGSSRIIEMSVRNRADMDVIDSQYKVNIAATQGGGALPATAGQITVNAGSMTVERKSTSPSGNVTNSASDMLLASYTFTAFGEPIKVETLAVALDTSGTDADYTLRNGRLMINGSQVGSTVGLIAAGIAANARTFTTNFVVTPGSPATVEVRGDIFDEEDTGAEFVAADTLQIALLDTNASNASRQVSLGTIDVPTGSNVNGNVLTITTGVMSLAKDQAYGNQSIVVPVSAYKLGQWVLAGSSIEDITISTFQLDLTCANALAAADIANLYLKYGSKTTTIKSSPTCVAAANTWSISENLAKNGTLTVEAYASLATAATDGGTDDTIIPSLLVSGTTASSGTAVNTNGNAVLAGQTITAVGAGTLTVTLDNGTPQPAIAVAGSSSSDGSLKVKLAGTNEVLYVKDVTLRTDATADDVVLASVTLWQAQGSGSFTQVSGPRTWDADAANPGFARWTLTGSDRITVPKDGTVYLLAKPTYVASSQATVTGQTPRIFLSSIEAEGTSVLVAEDNDGSDLIVEAGILIGGATPTFAADGTATTYTALGTTQTMTANAAPATDRTGSFVLIDMNADATYDNATDEIGYCMECGTGDGTLLIQRGVLGKTSISDAAGNIYFLAGINGNAITVLKTKLTVSVASGTPQGSTTGGTQRVIFQFNAAAANNAEDVAENKVVITSVDITTTKSGLTVNNVRVYPSEFDANATYQTACVALSTTEWRCTLVTTGATNEVVENTSRSYVVRADVGSGAGTSNTLDVSIASLGSSSAAGVVTAGDVVWTDNTTSISWVNQAGASYVQPSSPMTLGASSGSTDATVPTMSTIVVANGTGAANSVDALDTIVITLSERIDPTNINASLIPGGAAVTGVAAASTGGVTGVAADGIITVTNITTFDSGATLAAAASFTTDLTLNAAGTALTVTLNTGTARVVGTPALAAGTTVVGTATVGIKDVNGNVMASAASPTPTGSF